MFLKRSNSSGSRYPKKGLAKRNTHVKYESHSTYQSKVMTMLKVFKKVKLPRSNFRGSRSWHQMKGLAKRNTHVKYEHSTTYQSNVMTNVKVFEKKAKLHSQRSECQGHIKRKVLP
jgi:hypothetical protein